MKVGELAQIVSNRSGIEPQAVQKVLEAAFAVLGEALTKEEKVEFEGFGIFERRQNRKSDGNGKTLFRLWSATGTSGKRRKEGKDRRNAKKKTRKAKNESSP